MSRRAWIEAAEAWASCPRIRVAAIIVLALNLAATAVWLLTTHGSIDRFGQPVGGDFVLFYGAARLTWMGHPLLPFSHAAIWAAERAAVRGAPGLWFSYPPPFQMLIAPLGALSFPAAYALWTAAGVGAYLAMVRTVARGGAALLLACAFPGLFVTAWQGQTSLLVAAALGAGLVLLERRPWLGGALLGLLVCKPQFAVLLPVLLIGSGRWWAVGGAAASALGLCALATAALGPDVWRAFLAAMPAVSASMATGELPWAKMPSVFVALRLAGAPQTFALALQAVVAIGACGVTLVAWRRPGPWLPKAALAAIACLLATPYSFNYDLVLLAVPIAALAQHGRTQTAPAGTRIALALAAFTPTLFLGLASSAHLQLAPLAILALGVAAWRTDIAASLVGRNEAPIRNSATQATPASPQAVP